MAIGTAGFGCALAFALAAHGEAELQFPPAPGATLQRHGASAADRGGAMLCFADLPAAAAAPLWWGAAGAAAVEVELQDGPRVLAFDPGACVLPAVARWTGAAQWDDPDQPGPALVPVSVRCTLEHVAPAPALELAPAELGGAGVVLDAARAGGSFAVRVSFEVEAPANSGRWLALNELRQARECGGRVRSSFSAGFIAAAEPAAGGAARVSDLGGGSGGGVLGASAPVLGAEWRLSVAGAAPGSCGVILAGGGAAVLAVYRADAAGNARIAVPLPADPRLAAEAFAVQAFAEAGATNALAARAGF